MHMASMGFAFILRDWSVAEDNEFLRHRIQGEDCRLACFGDMSCCNAAVAGT